MIFEVYVWFLGETVIGVHSFESFTAAKEFYDQFSLSIGESLSLVKVLEERE